MRTLHTPGPWLADNVNTQDDSVTAIWQDDGTDDYYHRMPQIGECFWDPHGSETFDARPLTLAEAEANARLIAASPLLLQCCIKALAAWEGTGPAIILDELREAIKSAGAIES